MAGGILRDLYSSATIRLLVIPVIAAFAACLQLIFCGYPQGHDWLYELVRIAEYHDALVSGQGIPYWAGNLYKGFGSPIFIFYAPLYAACSALLMLFGMSVTTAAITVAVFFAIIASIGMALLTRELIGESKPETDSAARVASVAFVLAPYFLADLLVRNASAEFTALCLAPYPLWGLVLIFRGKRVGLPVLTFSFALVILAHNLTALVMASSLLIAATFCFLFQRQYLKFASAITAMSISMGLSAWFWVPALGLKQYVKIEELLLGKFDFHNNFYSISDMFSYAHLYSIGWIPPIILTLCLYVVFSENRNIILISLLLVGLILIFIQTDSSTIIWEEVPLFPLFQFPWRFMGPLSLVVALMLGILFKKYPADIHYAEIVILGILAVNAIPVFIRYQPLSNEYKSLMTSHIVKKNDLPATVGDEYLPRSAMKQLTEKVSQNEVVIKASGNIEKITARYFDNNQILIEAESKGQGEIHLAKWYFPVWRATLNGKSLNVSPDRSGAMQVSIPSGKHFVKIWQVQPNVRKFGFIISGISLLISVLILLFLYKVNVKNFTMT